MTGAGYRNTGLGPPDSSLRGTSVSRALRAMPGLLRVGFAGAVAYRAEFLIWVLAYTTPLIMLALWTAVAAEGAVGRFGEHEFSSYFAATLIVRLASGAWVIWDMNWEVRQGTLQRRLLWPIHALLTYLAENLAAIPMRIAVAIPIAIVTTVLLGTNVWVRDPVQLAIVPLSLLGAFLLTFLPMAIIGTLSLWWESSVALYDLWLALYTVFSGYVVPLELFPPKLGSIVAWLPFRQMLAFPVENLVGLINREQALHNLAIQWTFVLSFAVIATLMWRAGIKRFAAYGG
jgi:ABC-2 type transport system permease protein